MAVTGADARYPPHAEADVTRLILEHPLAWVVSSGGSAWRATPLPLRPEPVPKDQPIPAFLGHFARSNPQVELLRAEPQALLLFMGVSGYVSPSWFSDRTQAPTFNYASAQYRVKVEFIEDEAGRDAVLADLTRAMEAGRPSAWQPTDMGARYGVLAKRIVAFRAQVLERRVRFKLGQDERADVYGEILNGLGEGGGKLREWMEATNPGRRQP